MSDLPFGIDISKHQGVNDFAKMRANASFVFVKATESWGYTDPTFRANWQGFAGHNRGAYSYVYPESDPIRQAKHLVDTVMQAGADWQFDRLALDLERSNHGKTARQVTEMVLAMMEYIKQATGRYPLLYSRASWVNTNMLVTDPRIANADWWLANYLKALPYPAYTPEKSPPPFMPNGITNWLIHQTGEKGNGSAVGVGSYYVDTNRFNGTRDDVDAYFGRGAHNVYLPIITQPKPEPVPLFEARVYEWATPYVNVRERPNINAPKAGVKRPLDVMSVYEIAPSWYRIKEGWIMSTFLERLDKQEVPSLLAVPTYSQKDLRWNKDRLGSSDFTIEEKGCLITVTAAGLSYLGYPITPKAYNRYASESGGYEIAKAGKLTYANMYWKFPDKLTNGKVVRAEHSWIYLNVGWKAKADAILADKRPVWAEVRLDGNQHWVLIVGKNAGDYWALDPWTGKVGKFGYPAVYRIVSYRRVK